MHDKTANLPATASTARVSAWVACAAFFGLYGEGLSQAEREGFSTRLVHLSRRLSRLRWQRRDSARWTIAWATPEGRPVARPAPSSLRGAILGWRPASRRDGESAYLSAQEPIDLLGSLDGAWGAGWVDDREGVLLGRDRAGAQAVYYREDRDRLHFCSNLVCFNGLNWERDPEMIAAFLHFLSVPAPRTIYRGAVCVPPGDALSLVPRRPARRLPVRPPRSPDPLAPSIRATPGKRSEEFGRQLAAAISNFDTGGAPAGLLLSGGKDSSALAIAVKLAGLPRVTAFTIGFPDPRLDETEDGRRVAEHLGIPFVPLRSPLEEYVAGWDRFLQTLGQPLGDPASFSLHLSFPRIAEHCHLVFDGTGNDSYFGLLAPFPESAVWRLHRTMPGLHRLPWPLPPPWTPYRLAATLVMLKRPREEQFLSWAGWRTAEARRLTGAEVDWQGTPLYRLYREARSPMDHKTRTLCSIWEPEGTYRKTVQLAWAAGLEMAFPFLDSRIAAFVRALPEEDRFSAGQNKTILRRLLRCHLPASIQGKAKGYFIFPKGDFLAAGDYRILRATLSDEAIVEAGLVDRDVARPYLRRFQGGERSLEDRIWALAVLHGWSAAERAAAREVSG